MLWGIIISDWFVMKHYFVMLCALIFWFTTDQPRLVAASEHQESEYAQHSRAIAIGQYESAPNSPLQKGLIIEGAILQPFRAATVATELSGIIERFNYEEGDLVPEGHVVVEMSKIRAVANAERAQNRIKSMELALKGAKRNAKVKQKVFAKGASTQQEFLTAETSVEVKEAELQEAKQVLALALIDLGACSVKAPFTGHIDQRHKYPHEAVERLDKLFDIVDATQLFAVVNVPEPALPSFQKGRDALFVSSSGKEFKGVVKKFGKRIDPKSKTRKVYVLIPNSSADLEIGMSGSLRPGE